MKLSLCYPLCLPFTQTQKFGDNLNDFYKSVGMLGHSGIDYYVPENTPIYCTHDGYVIFCGLDNNKGLGIEVVTTQEYDYKETTSLYKTQYWHGNKAIVKVGDFVKAGQIIGYSGNTGMSTGPHLHFGIKPVKKVNYGYENIEQNNGYYGAIDPQPFLNGTYPNKLNKPVSQAFEDMQKAILAFQISEGITFFKDKPLHDVVIGKKTLEAIAKYK